MKIYCYPDDYDIIQLASNMINDKEAELKKKDTNQQGPIKKFFKKLENKHPKLWALTYTTLKEVEKSENLDMLKRDSRVGALKYISEPILEFRIPPTKSGGVVRLYFSYMSKNKDSIIILSAERKNGRRKADPEKIKQAIARYKKVCL